VPSRITFRVIIRRVPNSHDRRTHAHLQSRHGDKWMVVGILYFYSEEWKAFLAVCKTADIEVLDEKSISSDT